MWRSSVFAVQGNIVPTEDTDRAVKATAELLRERLAGVLPVDEIIVASLPGILGRLRRELLPLHTRLLNEVLLDPATDISALNRIKDYGKNSAARSTSSQEHDTAVAIYFAAIANALVFHDQKISTHSYATLKLSFTELADKPWMSPELVSLFGKAQRYSKAKQD